jgi:hypothetical protein
MRLSMRQNRDFAEDALCKVRCKCISTATGRLAWLATIGSGNAIKAAGYHFFDIYTPPLCIPLGINAGFHAHPQHLENLRASRRDPLPWTKMGERMEYADFYELEMAAQRQEAIARARQMLIDAGLV